jgi:hypothetical protein
MKSHLQCIGTTIGLTWSVGFLLLVVAGLIGVLPDATEPIWGGSLESVIESTVAASWFAVPLCVIALFAGFAYSTYLRHPGIGALAFMLAAVPLIPRILVDRHVIVPALIIALVPWLVWPLLRRSETSLVSAVIRFPLWIIATSMALGGVGIVVSAFLGAVGGAHGMKLRAMEAHTSYFSVSFGLAMSVLTVGVGLISGMLYLVQRLSRTRQ